GRRTNYRDCSGPLRHRDDGMSLIQRVDREAAEELGIEVGGLLWHHVASKRDIAELVEGDGLDEEGNIGLARMDHVLRFAGLANEFDVAELGDAFRREAEDAVEQ